MACNRDSIEYGNTVLFFNFFMMTFSLNKVMLMGRCTAPADVKKIEGNDLAVVNFTIVTNRKFTNSKNEAVTESEFHRCTAYGNSADILWKYLSKGKKMYVEGRLKTKKRTDATGNARQSTEIIVDNFIFLDNKAPEEEEETEEEIEMAEVEEDSLFEHIEK